MATATRTSTKRKNGTQKLEQRQWIRRRRSREEQCVRPSLPSAAPSLVSCVSASRRDARAHDNSSTGCGLDTLILLVVGFGCVVFVACALAVFSWLYAEYKIITGYMSVGRFVLEVLQRLWRGENPIPSRLRSDLQTADTKELVDRVLPRGSFVYKYVARYGVEAIDKLLHKHLSPETLQQLRSIKSEALTNSVVSAPR